MQKLWRILLSLITSVCFFFLVKEFISFYLADVYFTRAENLFSKGKFNESLENINFSIDLNPQEPNYYRMRAKVLVGATINQPEEYSQQLKTYCMEDIEIAKDLNPNNLATLRDIVPIYYYLSVKDISKLNTNENIDTKYLLKTQTYFDTLKKYSPNDVGIYVLLADYEKRLSLDSGYKETELIIKNLRPDLLDWYPSLID